MEFKIQLRGRYISNRLVLIFLLFLIKCGSPELELSVAHKILSLKIITCASGNAELCSTSKASSNNTTTNNNPPSSLTYSSSSFIFLQNITISNAIPSVTGVVTNCIVAPSLPTGLTLNSTSCSITGTPTVLSVNTNYTITASNSFGNTSTTIAIQVVNYKRMFVTAVGSLPGSDFNGPVGADTRCFSDANKPVSGTYKAFIVSSARIASTTPNAGTGQLDWVLLPTQLYTRTDGTIIGTTTANSLFTFPLTNAITSIPAQYFTGMNGDWTNAVGNCANWTDGTNPGVGSGVSGRGENTTNAILNGASGISCSGSATGQQLLCVEQ